MSAKKAPSVDVPTDAQKDERYEALAEFAGLANRYEAHGRMIALKSWCVDRGLADAPEDADGYVVSEPVVRRFLGPRGVEGILADGCDELALGERRADGRICLRDTSDLVAWRRLQSAKAKAGGEARAAADRNAAGQFVGGATNERAAGATAEANETRPHVVGLTNVQPGLQPETSQEPPRAQPLPSSLFQQESVCGDQAGSYPSGADPDLGGAGDRVHAPAYVMSRGEGGRLVNRFLTRVNAARVEIATKHKLGSVRPVALMGKLKGTGESDSGERELLARLAASADPSGDLEHVLDVAIAEADAEVELRWLGWSLASEKAWRSRLTATVAEVTRQRRRKGAIGSAAPRSDHGTEAADCNEVFG